MQNSNRKFITLSLLIATFLAAIEGTIVSTATAAIASDLRGVSLVNWIFAIYLLLMTVATPIFGKISDLYGRRLVFTFGAVIFLLGSMLCGVAQTMMQLIWFRALQGLGAGAFMPMTVTIVGDVFPFQERAKVMGLFSAIWGISGVIAPLIGGVLVDQLSWRWVFYINLPFGLISLLMLWIYYKENTNQKKREKIDFKGIVTFTVSITTFLLAVLTGGTVFPWFSMSIIGLFLVSVLFFLLFLYIETQVSNPMLPLSIFKIPFIFNANVIGFLLSMILIGVTIYIPIWVQGLYGLGATGAGMVLAPLSVAWVIGSNTVGALLIKWGPRKTMFIGLILLFSGTFGLSVLDKTSSPWLLALLMFIVGLGFGFSMTVVIVLGQSGIENNLRGIATATNTFLRTLGQTVGAAIYGAFFNYLVLRYSGTFINSVDELEQILKPEAIQLFSEVTITKLRAILFQSVHPLFWIMCLFTICSIVFALRIPNHQPED